MPYRYPAEPCRPHQLLRALSVLSLCLTVWLLASPALAQDALLEWFPIRPVNFNAVLHQQTFGPNDRGITVQAGTTALRYGDIEERELYCYFSLHDHESTGVKTDQHAILFNPRNVSANIQQSLVAYSHADTYPHDAGQ